MGGYFCVGEVALFVAEVLEAGLQVEGDGVVDVVAYVVSGEVFAELVAGFPGIFFVGEGEGVLVVDVAASFVGDVGGVRPLAFRCSS